MANLPNLARVARALGIDRIERHIFLCADQSNPKCCSSEEGLEAWSHLKSRLAEAAVPGLYRTKANCLRVCEQGPVAVVYPEGVWYHSASGPALDRIIDEHLLGGRVVEDLVFVRNGAVEPSE